MQQLNGRRISTAPRLKREYYPRPPENTEIVNYVAESWNEVNRIHRNSKTPNVMYYQPASANNRIPSFEPFDLESYWGKKVVGLQSCRENRSP